MKQTTATAPQRSKHLISSRFIQILVIFQTQTYINLLFYLYFCELVFAQNYNLYELDDQEKANLNHLLLHPH